MISPCGRKLGFAGDALTNKRMAFLTSNSSLLLHCWVSQEIQDEKPHFKPPFTDFARSAGRQVSLRSQCKLEGYLK